MNSSKWPTLAFPLNLLVWQQLILVMLVSLIVRFFYFQSIHHAFWFMHPMVDSANYQAWARTLLSGSLLGKGVFVHSPLYAFFLAGFYYLLGTTLPSSALAVQLLFLGPLSCGVMYLLGRRVLSNTLGLLAALAQAVYGPVLFYEGTLLTAQLIHLLNLLALLTAYHAINQDQIKTWIWPGVFLGLSILTRPNALLLLFVFGIWIWISQRRNLHQPKRVGLRIAVLCLSALVVVMPATLRNAVVLHETLLSVGNGGLNFYLGNNKDASGYHLPQATLGLSAANQVETAKEKAETALGRKLTFGQSSRYWSSRALHDILAEPGHWFKLLIKKFGLLMNVYEYTTSLHYYTVLERTPFLQFPWLGFGVLLPLALLGMFWARIDFTAFFPLFGLVVVYAFSNVSMLVSSEYRFALLPAFFIFAAYACIRLFQQLQHPQGRSFILPVFILMLCGLLTRLPLVPQALKHYHQATALLNFGATAAEQNDLSLAIQEFSSAATLLQDQPNALAYANLQLGKAYIKTNQPQLALLGLEQSAAYRPHDPDTLTTLANALTSLKQFPRALTLRRLVLKQNAANPEYWANLAITLLWMHQDAAADQAFNRVLALNPGLAPTVQQTRSNILYYRDQPAR